MGYCSKCGNEMPVGARFCSACGADSGVTATSATSQVREEKKINRCPQCYGVINAFDHQCPTCMFEFRDLENSKAVKNFASKLETVTEDSQRINLIKSFAIPNTREDILEFMILATSNFDGYYYLSHLNEEDCSDAWLAKIEQCYQKAKLVFGNDRDFQRVEKLYNDVLHKIGRKKSEEEIKAEKKRRKVKCCLFASIALISLIAVFVFVWLPLITTIELGVTFYEINNISCKEAQDLFEQKGFSNVSIVESEGWKAGYEKGEIISITIDGNKSFYAEDRFSRNAEIVITYNADPIIVSIGFSDEDCMGADFESIKDALKSKGFGNIELKPNPWNPENTEGIITEITVGTSSDFSAEESFSQDVKIVICYNPEPQYVYLGLSSKEIKGQDCSSIESLLISKGFLYIETKADGWSFLHKSGTVKEISIDGKKEFEDSDSFKQDALIVITYYE